MTILVMSCDKNDDLFPLYHHCIEKYWPDHPEVVYCTETKVNPYYRTICKNYTIDKWTRRLREAAQEINDTHILLMMDDTFIRRPVNVNILDKLCDYVNDYLIAINLEPPPPFMNIDLKINNILNIRHPDGQFHASLQPQIWYKSKLLELFGVDCDPWKAESLGDKSKYSFGSLSSRNVDFDYGKIYNLYPFSIVQGKWTKEVVKFFKDEGIELDLNKRRMYD